MPGDLLGADKLAIYLGGSVRAAYLADKVAERSPSGSRSGLIEKNGALMTQ